MPYNKKRTRKSYKRRGAARGKVYGAAAGLALERRKNAQEPHQR